MRIAKINIALIILLIMSFCLAATAFSFASANLDVTLLSDEKKVFSVNYKIPFRTYLELNAKYKNNYTAMLKKEYKGNLKAFFSALNSDIYEDIREFCNNRTTCPKDARATYEGNGEFSYEPEIYGKSYDYLKVLNDLTENNFSPTEITYRTINPSLTVRDLEKSTRKMSSFSTDYRTSSESRKRNIELAAKRIRKTIVYPDELFSFNAAVGKRTTENGFSEAKIILNGEYVDGIGGGVCQVASTLMNAWIKAGLDVQYSRNHSLVPSYLPPGTDCTVSENIDLVLKNTSPYPVYIDSYANGTFLNFTVYGLPHEYVIKIESELIKEIPFAEYDIEENEGDESCEIINRQPVNGKIYRSYIVYYKNGKIQEKKFFRFSYYLPQKGKKIIIKQG